MLRAAVLVTVGAFALSACSSSDSDSGGDPNAGAGGADLTTVTLALDYLPSPAHSGLAYAIQAGLFKDEGINVKILPYASTSAEVLVSAGKADVGFTSGIGLSTQAMAAGSPIKAFFNAIPHDPAMLSVLKSSEISRPANLAGKTYGGFGSPVENAIVDQMIATDGGSGSVKQVVLSVGSTEALKAEQVDAAMTYPDELRNFEQQDVEVTTWKLEDYGVPELAGIQVFGSNTWLKDHPDLARGFATALQAGYEVALDEPEAASKALQKQFTDIDPTLADFMTKYYAENLLSNPHGPIGTLKVDEWQAYADWAINNKLLTDSDGEPVTTFESSTYVTNEFLPTP